MYDLPVQNLIDEFGRLPGIGPKSAQRIAFHLLKLPETESLRLAHAIIEAKERGGCCEQCWNISEEQICRLCSDIHRDNDSLCVVEEPRDVAALEKAGYRGRYHVLQGALNPKEGIGPEQLRIKEVIVRLSNVEIQELIVCTNPNIEGEATAMYLARQFKPLGIKVTRIASGLPVGGDLEYADELTLGRALEGRRDLNA